MYLLAFASWTVLLVLGGVLLMWEQKEHDTSTLVSFKTVDCFFAVGGESRWNLRPECVPLAGRYARAPGGYAHDVGSAYASASEHYASLENAPAGSCTDVLIFDIDETLLSNLPELERMGLGSWNQTAFDVWVNASTAPALEPALHFYREMHKRGFSLAFVTGRPGGQRAATLKNLENAGYGKQCASRDVGCKAATPCFIDLFLRETPEQQAQLASVYKPAARLELEQKHAVKVAGLFGDQWSDLSGANGPGNSSALFKMPNPWYYVA